MPRKSERATPTSVRMMVTMVALLAVAALLSAVSLARRILLAIISSMMFCSFREVFAPSPSRTDRASASLLFMANSVILARCA